MKCINMQIGGIVIFLANFITIYSSSSLRDKISSQTTTAKDDDNFKNKLSEDCPQLLETVSYVNKMYNVTDFGIDCKMSPSETISKESTLQRVCFVVNNLLNIICDRHLVMTTVSLNKADANVCPFVFSHLDQFGVKLQYKELVDELTRTDHCSIICYYDLNKPKPQCIILSLYNKYLISESQKVKQKIVVPQHETEKSQISKLAETGTTIQKTENPAASSKMEQEQEKSEILKPKTETSAGKMSEAPVTAPKAVKVENKTEKLEAPITSTPKKEPTSESEMKAMGVNDNFMPENIDEDLNEDDLGPGIPPDMTSGQNNPKVEPMEEQKLFSSRKIYPDNGFFQAEDSHFFFYFIMVSSALVLGYLAFHNKNKILAYALEGASSRRRGRRPNPARYKKLETNLEEVISSNSTNVAASSVVY